MKSVLVIDDMWERNDLLFEDCPDFNGVRLIGFSSSSDALDYLKSIDPKEYPDTCILDAIVSHFGQGIPFVDTDAGVNSALSLEAFFKKQGQKNIRFIFKSEDSKFAQRALEEFRRLKPDYQAATITPYGRTLRIDSDGYEPPSIPEMAKDFMSSASELHPMDVFESLKGDPLQSLHAFWDDLADVNVKDENKSVAFSYGSGSPKSGVIVRSLGEIKTLPHGEKGIFIARTLPEGLLQYADRLSAIVIVDDFDFPGHLKLLLKPSGISLLVGSQSKIQDDMSGVATIHPLGKKLYQGKLDIVDIEATMPRLVTYLNEMDAVAKDQIVRSSIHASNFRVNLSSPEDRNQNLPVGLTRTEHFCGPYVNPQAFERLKDFLIGQGAELRRLFNRAGERHGNLPFISKKKETYDRDFRLVVPLPTTIGSFYSEDVIRLLDIPVDEFFSKPEQDRYKELYGNVRGVKLAQKIPDLYINQLRPFAGFGRFHSEGPPLILIPAVENADDIAFVKACASEALPPRLMNYANFGAMIDSKRGCDNIAEIAKVVSHISIGSNDLTSDLLGISRQDPGYAHKFASLPKEIIPILAGLVQNARSSNANVTISLCGEAAADIDSLKALQRENVYFDYFSVPPTFKDTRLLPLVYNAFLLESFCGPLKEEDPSFYLEPRKLQPI